MKISLKPLFFALVPFLLISCFSLNTHQTARTLGTGEVSIQMINGFSGVPTFTDDPNNATSVGFTGNQFQAALGVKDNLDVGVTLGINKLGFLSKYQILGNRESKFALATGFYAYRSFGNTIDFANMNAVEIPIFFSYHPAEWLSIYSNPMLTYFDIEDEGIIGVLEEPFYQTGAYKGLSSGLIFEVPLENHGLRITTSLDMSWMSPLESNRYIFYTTMGVGIKFKTGWFNSK
ncbi:MAG: hypothetical protein ACI9XJ_002493 [Marivirga sp.]|jgi:hypothetical protein